ncbi:sperm surface protein Sp17 [Aricia agestis]|uniref:sperm surface protein Sp17 n=1 Tax=Aricia agestis TaxID=91739 RepID=UPI001C20B5E9|nr:sperm surface protein Sp17 [Aricia agestis]
MGFYPRALRPERTLRRQPAGNTYTQAVKVDLFRKYLRIVEEKFFPEDKSKETKQGETSEEEAARKIQAAFRGHQTRKSIMKSAKPEPEPTRAELEAEFRADDKDVVNAATKIQASFRGHQARKQTQAEKEKEMKEQQDKEDIEKIDLTDPDLNKAATKIQASFRGHKVRKDVN